MRDTTVDGGCQSEAASGKDKSEAVGVFLSKAASESRFLQQMEAVNQRLQMTLLQKIAVCLLLQEN